VKKHRRRRSVSLPIALAIAAIIAFAVCAVVLWKRVPPLVAGAILYVAAAWAIAGGVTFLAFLAVSLDDIGDVARTAIRGSAPAMWIAPALLLLASPNRWAEAAGMLLISAAACLLSAQRAPRRLVAMDVSAESVSTGLFRDPGIQQSWIQGSLFPVTLGALALQAGLWCWYAEYRLAAAELIALAIGAWTRSWVARGAARERRPGSPVRSLGALALVLLLTLGSSVASFEEAPVAPETESAGLLEQTRRTLERLAWPELPKPPARESSAIPVVSAHEQGTVGHGGIPGVILRPKSKPRRQYLQIAPPLPGMNQLLSDPLTFPFTGEYHIFRTSSGSLPDGAPVQDGTPLEAVYVTTNGGSMETQAYQPLIPPVDFSRCGQVRLTVRSGEAFPGGAALQLLSDAGLENLGTQVFGMEGSAEETLPYFVPDAPRRLPVKALRVVFLHDPSQVAKSTKAAIVGFTLVPRAY
jgi:hypothetical protein